MRADEYLMAVRNRGILIDKLIKDKETLYTQYGSIKAVDYSKDKVDGSHTEDLSGLVEQIEEARNRLNVRITKEMLMFEKEKLLAVSMILSIGNCGGKTANVQRVLLDYYVHHVDYKDIAGQMGYSKRSVERLSRQGVREIQVIIDSSKLNSLEKIFT